jgi:putative transposase
MSDLPAVVAATPWAAASEEQRRVGGLRIALVGPLARLVQQGSSVNRVAKLLATQLAGQVADATLVHIAQQLDAGGVLSEVTIKRWLSAYLKHGKEALLPKHTGRVRQAADWHVRAAYLWANPAKRGYAEIARRLRHDGYPEVTARRVQLYVQSLPGSVGGEMSPARIGKHQHKLNRQHYVRRNLDEVLVGEIYAGDGHTCDCYVAHPNTGGLFRPELTAFIDIKSRFIVGWWLSESETKESTLFALSAALVRYDHVNAAVYVDRGAGYRAKLLSDASTGYYEKFDMSVIAAIPGNPNGKAWIERFFKTFRNNHDKFFADGATYCGDDMADETNRRLSVEVKQGKRQLPSYQSYVDSVRRYMDEYHLEPMDVLDGQTPAQVWAQLVPVPVHMQEAAVVRPRIERTVSHQEVRFGNRHYFAESLGDWDGKKVVVEYDLHDDRIVWVMNQRGALLCTAQLVHTIGVLPTSRLEEQRNKREAGQVRRLQNKLSEVHGRRQDPITAETQAKALEDLRAATPLAPPSLPTHDDDDFDIDLTLWRKD